MEHGKFSISKIWHIAKMEYIKLIMDPRMILIVAALVFAYQFITVPLLPNAAMMGKPINVYEPFVALLNSNFMILLVPAVFLAIMEIHFLLCRGREKEIGFSDRFCTHR